MESTRDQGRVTVSVAVFNKLEYTIQCLQSIFRTCDPALYDLVIVNNASTDGTTEWLNNVMPGIAPKDKNRITVLNNLENIGFARAHNQAFRECKTEFFLLLNNDTLARENWLPPMVKQMSLIPNAGVVGSKLITPMINGIQHAGVVFDGIFPVHRLFGAPSDHPTVIRSALVPAVTGACLMIRSEIFAQLNGLDERFVNGWEDMDLCLKVRELGFEIVYEAGSVLYHYEGQTEGRMLHDDQNRDLFVKLWGKKLLDEVVPFPRQEAKA